MFCVHGYGELIVYHILSFAYAVHHKQIIARVTILTDKHIDKLPDGIQTLFSAGLGDVTGDFMDPR